MRHYRHVFFAVLFVAFIGFAAFGPLAFGQATSTGGLTGTVTDPQGASVAGAKVTVASSEIGVSLNGTTDSSGYYTIGALAPGKYSLNIESTNFKTFQTTAVIQVG